MQINLLLECLVQHRLGDRPWHVAASPRFLEGKFTKRTLWGRARKWTWSWTFRHGWGSPETGGRFHGKSQSILFITLEGPSGVGGEGTIKHVQLYSECLFSDTWSKRSRMAEEVKTLRLEEVKKHNVGKGPDKSIWTVIHDKVYDITNFLDEVSKSDRRWHYTRR